MSGRTRDQRSASKAAETLWEDFKTSPGPEEDLAAVKEWDEFLPIVSFSECGTQQYEALIISRDRTFAP
jgi:hypothetical protein